MSEGAGFVILEPLERAIARVHASTASSPATDGTATRITSPRRLPGGAGAAVCMQLALDDAGIDASAIGHVNAHGTSTPLNDASEAEALHKVFGDHAPPVTSTKGVTGHMIGAAGAVEAVIALLSLRDGIVPPTANLEKIGDEIDLDIVFGEPRPCRAGAGVVELVRFRRPQRHADHRASGPTHGRVTEPAAPTPVFGHRSEAVQASLRDLDGRRVSWFNLDGGKHRGAIGTAEGQTIERAVHLAVELGIPIVGRVASSGADVNEGVAALHAWGRVAKALSDASGVVPIVLLLDGPAVSGPALLLGIADHVIMTADSFAYVTGPDVVVEFTGVPIDRDRLGGSSVHERLSGVATMVVRDENEAMVAVTALLSYLPSNHLEDPPFVSYDDPDRDCTRAADAVPARAAASYDVRVVINDVLDRDSFLELKSAYAPSLVTGLGRLDQRTVGVIANQPMHNAGSLDVDAAQKAARFVQWCDCFNIAVITFVDTSGYLPGRDLEWRGIIRHGAQLLHAYAGGDGAPHVRRAAQGVRRRLHRDGLAGSEPTGASPGPRPRSR